MFKDFQKYMLKNMRKAFISTICDIIGIAAVYFTLHSVVHEQYVITACGLGVLGYLVSLEIRGKIYPW